MLGAICCLVLAIMVGIACWQVVSRYILGVPSTLTGFLGYILGPILNAYLSAGMGDVIGLALGGTALVFFCCSAYV
ncbi:hypothetical protein MJL22_29055, partial [Salmonella enterica subsp. enterica serovar Montevideo]|nr:hypothetical protein [Salmonella enterica subsp. enterica serovar Montevideo]